MEIGAISNCISGCLPRKNCESTAGTMISTHISSEHLSRCSFKTPPGGYWPLSQRLNPASTCPRWETPAEPVKPCPEFSWCSGYILLCALLLYQLLLSCVLSFWIYFKMNCICLWASNPPNSTGNNRQQSAFVAKLFADPPACVWGRAGLCVQQAVLFTSLSSIQQSGG